MCLQIPSLAGYAALQTLELSYNSISSLQPLTQLQNMNLAELYVANNAVQRIEVLNPVSQTGTIDLQCRSYQSILCSMYHSQLSMHVALNSQYGLGGSGSILLGNFVQAVQHFTSLRLLELGSNKIRQIQGLDALQSLQELWLGQNRITQISGIDQ